MINHLEKCFHTLHEHNLTILKQIVLLAFLQFLEFFGLSFSAFINQLLAIKATFTLFGQPTDIFVDSRIKYFQKTMFLQRPLKANLKKFTDILTLESIIKMCDIRYASPGIHIVVKWSKPFNPGML